MAEKGREREEAIAQAKLQRERFKNLAGSVEALDKTVKGSVTLLTQFNATMPGLLSQVGEFVGSADKLQQSFVGTGSNITREMDKTAKALDNLGVGTIKPLEERLKFIQEGFASVTDSSIRLATQMSFTGQSSDSMRRVLKDSILQGGMSLAQGDEFIKTMSIGAKSHGLQTQFLADAMDRLSETLEPMDFVGTGKNLRVAMSELTSEYSIASDDLTAFLGEFTKASNVGARGIAGTQKFVATLFDTNATISEQKNAIVQAFLKTTSASQALREQLARGQFAEIGAQRTMDIFGQRLTMSALRMDNAYKLGANTYKESTTDWTKSLGVQQSEFMNVIEKFGTTHFQHLINSFDTIVSVGIVGSITAWIASYRANALALHHNTTALRLAAGKTTAAAATGGLMGGLGKAGIIGSAIATIGLLGFGIYQAFAKDTAKSTKATAKYTKKVADTIKTPAFGTEKQLHQDAINRAMAVFSANRMRNVNPQAERDMKTMIKLLEEASEHLDLVNRNTKNTAKNTKGTKK